MEIVNVFLSPIVWCMGSIFSIYVRLTDSAGFSLLLLSFTFSLILYPISRWCENYEKRISTKIAEVKTDTDAISSKIKGKAKFMEVEKIYLKHKYHPIYNILLGIRFFVAIPILIAAIIMISNSTALIDQPFGVISDLSASDSLGGVYNTSINVLPVLMLIFTFIDAKIRYAEDRTSQIRFYFISIVLFVLVYPLPSGLIIYWIGTNIFAFVIYLTHRSRQSVDAS